MIISSIDGIDYSPKQFSLVFQEASNINQTKCQEIEIIQDGLDEEEEGFVLELRVGGTHNAEATFSILACQAGGRFCKIHC